MITSSKINSVTFKDTSGSYPNKWNTLNTNRKMAGYGILDYCQKYDKDDVLYLQFTSDSATTPTLTSFGDQVEIEIVSLTSSSSYSGDVTRYFYTFEVTLGASYYDKEIYFTVEQDGDTLTSEPILVYDLSDDLTNGELVYIKYTNLDRNESDLSDYWIDWSEVSYMYFYIEGVDREAISKEDIEVLEGSQSKTIISANNYSGIKFQTGQIPDYLAIKLAIVSNLDYFEINGLEYIKEGETEIEPFGESNLFQVILNLTEKNTIGLNVDDVGITQTDTDMAAIEAKRNTEVDTGGWEITNPDGYMLHSVFIKHAATSAADAVVNLGTTVGGDELIDDIQGNVTQADYTSKWKSISRHYLNDPDNSSTLYLTVSGAGAVLDIIVNFDTVTEN